MIEIIGRRSIFALASWTKRECRVVRIVAVGKEFFEDLWRERRESLFLSHFLSISFSFLLCALTSTWAKSIEARRRRRYGSNENLRKGIYPTCRNISSARSLTLYSDLFYAGESGSARLQFRKVSRVPRVVCTPRVWDFGNLRESSGSSARPSSATTSSGRRPTSSFSGRNLSHFLLILYIKRASIKCIFVIKIRPCIQLLLIISN